MWHYGDMGGGWWVFGLMWLLFLVAVGLGVWLIVRSTGRAPTQAQDTYRAEDLLRERYARGDLSDEAFERGMEALRRSRR